MSLEMFKFKWFFLVKVIVYKFILVINLFI